jgi:SAM-dependent methyltransferase
MTYDGVNDLAAFTDRSQLDAYRDALLEHTVEGPAIAATLKPGARVYEVGCGSGRLLVDLARRCDLAEGVGIDVATTRIAFAERWADDEGLAALRFTTADALEPPIAEDRFDAAICVTGLLGYFGAAEPRADEQLVAALRRALRRGGAVWIEVYPHPRKRALLEAGGGRLRLWDELPDHDPWRFYLSDLELRGDVLTHRKTFVHRDDARVDSGRSERVRLYGVPDIEALLSAAGFGDVVCTEGWTDDPYDGGELLVARARAS